MWLGFGRLQFTDVKPQKALSSRAAAASMAALRRSGLAAAPPQVRPASSASFARQDNLGKAQTKLPERMELGPRKFPRDTSPILPPGGRPISRTPSTDSLTGHPLNSPGACPLPPLAHAGPGSQVIDPCMHRHCPFRHLTVSPAWTFAHWGQVAALEERCNHSQLSYACGLAASEWCRCCGVPSSKHGQPVSYRSQRMPPGPWQAYPPGWAARHPPPAPAAGPPRQLACSWGATAPSCHPSGGGCRTPR